MYELVDVFEFGGSGQGIPRLSKMVKNGSHRYNADPGSQAASVFPFELSKASAAPFQQSHENGIMQIIYFVLRATKVFDTIGAENRTVNQVRVQTDQIFQRCFLTHATSNNRGFVTFRDHTVSVPIELFDNNFV